MRYILHFNAFDSYEHISTHFWVILSMIS